jgi:uncharacterized OsmC-like protein
MATPHEIKAALERASNTVSLKPAIGQRTYVTTAVLETGLVCRTEEKKHAITADLHPAMGGDDCGPSPAAIFRAALSSCIAVGVKMWAARKDVEVDRIEVRVETDVDARGQFGLAEDVPPGFGAIRMNIHVDSQADPARVREVVDLSLRLSPLIDAITRPQSLTTHVGVGRQPPEC